MAGIKVSESAEVFLSRHLLLHASETQEMVSPKVWTLDSEYDEPGLEIGEAEQSASHTDRKFGRRRSIRNWLQKSRERDLKTGKQGGLYYKGLNYRHAIITASPHRQTSELPKGYMFCGQDPTMSFHQTQTTLPPKECDRKDVALPVLNDPIVILDKCSWNVQYPCLSNIQFFSNWSVIWWGVN